MTPDKAEYDLIVVGSGAAGLTAALVASIKGLDVLLLERADVLGGTTAISAGSGWVPNSHYDTSGKDSKANARRYLDATVGGHAPDDLKDAFLDAAPAMARLLADHSEVRFRPYPHLPDYYSERDGATMSGRVLETLPFDGRRLGRDFALIRPPLPEFTILGGMMVSRSDIAHLLNAFRNVPSFVATVCMLLRHARDRISHPRGTRLVMGNALVARFLHSLLERGATIKTAARARALIVEDGAVRGVLASIAGKPKEFRARRGVVLAAGGFTHHPRLRAQLLPAPITEFSPVPSDNEGDGVDIGLQAGGAIGRTHANNAFWAPVSVRPRRDGTMAVFPHFALDRGKPGLIAVNGAGQRFVNEATSYQMFVEAIYASQARTPSIPCFFICDHAFLKKYGLGMIRPGQVSLRAFIDDGYLASGQTIAQLASALGIDPQALVESIERYNGFARTGKDIDFHKGESAYSRNIGDPAVAPNPNLGPIETAPFYAIRIYPGDIGTSAGLITNTSAQVLNAGGEPIKGLYAAGNDMNSVMGGVYAGPGCTIGTAMTFGYIAAMHAAG